MITPEYRSDIDGLRGIAVLMAVAFHAFPTVLHGGFIGVEIFFVVSGFLIGIILLQATQVGSFSYVEFYARRIRRIFPALIAMLAVFLIAGWFTLLSDEYRQLGKHTLAGAGFISNIAHWRQVSYFDTAAETKPLLHLWSLGVEEQFYIFLPPLLLMIARFRLNVRRTVGILWVLSFIGNLYLTSIDKTQAFYSPLPRLWELLTGCLLASLYLTPQHRLSVWAKSFRANKTLINCVAVAGLALIAAPSVLLHRTSYFPGGWTLLPVTGTTLLIIVGRLAWLNRAVLSNRMLMWVGQISYPLYLWHWPLLSFGRALEGKEPTVLERLTLIAISVVLATLTYMYIEKPVRSGRWRKHAVTVLSVLLLIAAAAGAYIWKGDGLQLRLLSQKEQILSSAALLNLVTMNKYALSPCGENAAIIGNAKAICSSTNLQEAAPQNNTPLLVLWGDSHVKSWLPVFSQIAQERGMHLIVFDYPGCAPLLNVRRTDPVKGECRPELADDVMQSIENLKPAQVVLISNWNLYINGWTSAGVLQVATHFLTDDERGDADRASSHRAFSRQFPNTIARLSASGARILVLKAPPILHESINSGYVRHPSAYEPSFQEYRDTTTLSSALIDTATQNPRIKSFDTAAFLCEKKCAAIYQNTVMYGDDNHLTTTACLMFKPQLEKLITNPAAPASQ